MRRQRPSADSPPDAELVALSALEYIAQTDDLLSVFLGATGLSPEDVAAAAADPQTLAAVLDFLLQDDAWVIDFAAAKGLDPGAVADARRALPGGDLPHWT